MVTDEIECFTEIGIKLKNAQTVLEADMIVTATGLSLQVRMRWCHGAVFRAPGVANTSLVFAVDPSINAMQFVVQSACDA